MGFNGSGTFVRLYNWQTDAANSVNITASRMDGEDDGFASGLSNCITRDGQSPALANIPMGGFKITGLANGSAATDAAAYGQLASYFPLTGGTLTGKLTTVASAVGRAGFNVPAGTAPTTPVAGDLWNVSGTLYYYTGSLTRQVATLDGTETFTNKTYSGGTISPPASPAASNPGTAGLVQNNITANYTLVIGDVIKEIYITGTTAAQTVTIPANASVAFPVGTVIQITNDSNQSWSVAITSDTLFWTPSGGTGTRTIAAGSKAIIEKKTATRWWISGNSIS